MDSERIHLSSDTPGNNAEIPNEKHSQSNNEGEVVDLNLYDADVATLVSMACSSDCTFSQASLIIDELFLLYRTERNWHDDSNFHHYHDNTESAHQALLDIYDYRQEYFLRLKINQLLKEPLSDASPQMQVRLLEQNGVIHQEFSDFVADNRPYCEWQQWQWDKDKLEHSTLRDIGVEPNYENYQMNIVSGQRRFKEACLYTKLDNQHGAIFTQSGGLDKIFELPEAFIEKEKSRQEKFGRLSEDHYEFYVKELQEAVLNKDNFGVLKVLQIYPSLAQDDRLLLTEIFGSQIHQFEENHDFSEFEHVVNQQAEVLQNVVNNNFDRLAELVNNLEHKLHDLKNEAAIAHFGYRNENIDLLDFFQSMLNQSPYRTHPPHHTLFYYLAIRHDLPSVLVSEFEETFAIDIPPDVKKITSYDEYLTLPSGRLFQIFESGTDTLANQAKWLAEHIEHLQSKIKDTLPQAVEMSLDDVVRAKVPQELVRQVGMKNYESMLSPQIRLEFKKQFKFDLANLDVRTQFSVLNFLSRTNEEQVTDLATDISTSYTNEVARKNALIVLLGNERFGNQQFLDMLSYYNAVPEISTQIFEKYAGLVSEIEEIEQFTESQFSVNVHSNQALSIREQLIKKAHDILHKHYGTIMGITNTKMGFYMSESLQDRTDINSISKIDVTKHSSVSPIIQAWIQEHVAKITNDIDSLSVQTNLFLASFKSLSTAGIQFSIDDIKDSEFLVAEGGQLSPEDILVMKGIYSTNQADVGAHDEIIEHFEARVVDNKTRFYIFKWQGNIQSFIAFTESEDGTHEATSFNVNPEARGSRIGEAMLHETIDREASAHTLVGECYADLPITSKYIETGWVAHNFFNEPGKEAGTIDSLFSIRRDDVTNGTFWSKGATRESIESGVIPDTVIVEYGKTTLDLPLHLLQEGYALTRLFKNPTGLQCGVFEKVPN